MPNPDPILATFPLMKTLDTLVERYGAMPEKKKPMSAHATMAYTSLEKEIQDTFSSILNAYNTMTPAHWPDLMLAPIFHRTMSVCIAPSEKTNPSYCEEYHGRPYKSNTMARFMGIMYALLEMRDEPMNPRCQNRWDQLDLPSSFDKPSPIHFSGHEYRANIPALSLHDAVGQASVLFYNWGFNTLYSGSRRVALEESFTDGQNWLKKKYFDYLYKSWMVDSYFLDKIKKTKLLAKSDREALAEKLGIMDIDETFFLILTLLNKTKASRTEDSYSVFLKGNYRRETSSLHMAKGPAHALAQAIVYNISLFRDKQELKRHDPRKWKIFKNNPVQEDVLI